MSGFKGISLASEQHNISILQHLLGQQERVFLFSRIAHLALVEVFISPSLR